MLSKLEGFEVEVTVKDAIPHVWVRFADGRPVVDTDALSIRGMERMGSVFARAARMAYNELDMYWQIEHQKLRQRRATGQH